jgi:hypothetical protein
VTISGSRLESRSSGTEISTGPGLGAQSLQGRGATWCYKAVQRSAQVVSIGPMLQGLAKPVNDLSRGALVDDIVYTLALTAIQSRTG